MMKMKTVAQAILGMAASVAASAAMAAAPSGNASALINQAMLAANNLTLTTLGAASYTTNGTTGNLALTAAQSTTTTSLVDYTNADGFKLTGSSGAVSFVDLSFNVATNTLNGAMKLGIVTLYATGPIAVASFEQQVADAGDGVADLLVSNFTLAPDFAAAVNDLGIDPATVPLGDVITSITIENYGFAAAPVPEPSTYALMGLGLVGLSLVARRRQA